MQHNLANNSASVLTQDIDIASTTMSVREDIFPQSPFYATLDDNATNIEIVEVIAKNGLNFTINRAKDNTTAKSFKSGAVAELRWIKALVDEVDISAGMVCFFARNSPPSGWLECNGASISRTVYAKLFTIIGTTFGGGNGSTTFNLPDLRGYFIRGWDNGRGADSGRTFGSSQLDTFLSHSHSIYYYESSVGSGDAAWYLDSGPGYQGTQWQTTSSTGDSETRPKNVALLPCIKY